MNRLRSVDISNRNKKAAVKLMEKVANEPGYSTFENSRMNDLSEILDPVFVISGKTTLSNQMLINWVGKVRSMTNVANYRVYIKFCSTSGVSADDVWHDTGFYTDNETYFEPWTSGTTYAHQLQTKSAFLTWINNTYPDRQACCFVMLVGDKWTAN